jgi:hypothetical protein
MAVEQDQHVARERAGPDTMDAIVGGEAVLKLKREARLVTQAGNAQACATTHGSGQNAHPRHPTDSSMGASQTRYENPTLR